MLVLDTSGVFAALAADDLHHRECTQALDADGGPFLIPAGILAEVGYMIETRLGVSVLDAFLGDLVAGAFTLECGEDELPRVRELVDHYRDMPLGFADAAVIACAEQAGGRVLSFDRRDFGVVAREGRIHLVP